MKKDYDKNMKRIITFTTDFGSKGGYVGAMKGVAYSIAQDVQCVDITHSISPQDRLEGALTLCASVPYFPSGSIHVAVIDPGVGTNREAIAVSAGEHFFVGPDNGLLEPIVNQLGFKAAVSLNKPKWWRHPVSATFHGRDIFTPVAAYLANATQLLELGVPRNAILPLDIWPKTINKGSDLVGEVVSVDSFGNMISNISAKQYSMGDQVYINGTSIPVVETYGSAGKELSALFGSGGYLELAVKNGSAALRLNEGVGLQIMIRKAD